MFVPQNPDLQKPIVESVQTIAPTFEKRRSEIIDIVARVYATKFTEAEMKELLVFYRSTVGKKFVAEQAGRARGKLPPHPGVECENFGRDRLGAARGNEEARSQYLTAPRAIPCIHSIASPRSSRRRRLCGVLRRKGYSSR